MNILDKIHRFTEAKRAMEEGYYPYFIPIEETEGTEVVINGKRVIMAGSNNYLGLTHHPKVKEAAINAIRKYGTSCTGSRFLNGTLKLHHDLEIRLARFVGKEAAICFTTGFQTNLGIIDTLAGKKDVALLDKEDHASLYDGARIAQCTIKRFKHNDATDLEKKLSSLKPEQMKLVAVDGVFSMEGDLSPLPEILKICRKHKAFLVVDDAHSIGVMGNGRGTAAYFGIKDGVNLIVGTFSKSLASLGGFAAGDKEVIHYIKHHARALIFSASIPPANAASAMAALEIIENEPERIESLHKNAEILRKGLLKLGFDTGNSITPIIPVIIGNRILTVKIAGDLLKEGIFVNPIISPAVPVGRDLIRTSCMATHTEKQLDRILEAFEKTGRKFGLIK